ncbi:hypothetical protein [Planosporangium mesophilum]|uniref:hypothetical protein n=1 Tax=Planosporangium mesophilum TaxID=689768 RepID=UPI001EF2E21E|nr:hypothetical protein [Planosporangium mesophilum]
MAMSADAVASRTARATGKPVQVTSRTSETTEVWAQPDGSFKATIAAGVVRIRKGGVWVPVDLTLRREADGSVVPGAHPNDARIAGALPPGEHELASVRSGAGRMAMRWRGALPAPALSGNRATYADALPGIDLVVEATTDGIEQFLVVKSAAAAHLVREVNLGFSGDRLAGHTSDRDGATVLRDGAGAEVARIPVPTMWDSRPPSSTGEPGRETAIRTRVSAAAGGGVQFALLPDLEWMTAPGTAWPVIIDPVLSPAPSVAFDTYVREGDTTANSTNNDLWAGLASGQRARSFVHWNTGPLVGKQITASTVQLWNWWSNSCVPYAWEIWPTGPAAAATLWDDQPQWYDGDPSVPGDQPSGTSTQTKGYDSTCDDGAVTVDGRLFFQYAADHSLTVAPMGIRTSVENDSNIFKQFRSANNTVTSVYPIASVTYNSYPEVTARATTPSSPCVTGAERPTLQTMAPTLSATVTDAEATAASVTFEWWTLTGSAPIGKATVTGVASGATASTTIPAGALGQAGSYRWRVLASDGTVTSTSSWCEFTLYDFAPPVDGCAGGVDGDYNGDGVADTAIADPEATVNGQEKAGQVHIVYGGTGIVQTVTESNARVMGGSEAGDQFGTALATYDANRDGCADLAVGTPYEDLNGLADVGSVYVLLGSPAGLAKGPASVTLHQDQTAVPDTAEAKDWFGFSVAAGRTAAGESYLVIGAPGEDLGGVMDAGLVHYIRGTLNVALDQSTAGAGEANEQDDRFGYSVSGSPYHIAAGRPGESVGNATFAGAVSVYSHDLLNGLPKLVVSVSQDSPGVSGGSETDDQMGKSVALAPYRAAGAPVGQPDSVLLVGVPGEDLTIGSDPPVVDAGVLMRFQVTTTGLTQMEDVSQATAGFDGAIEDGDYFGEKVAVVNLAPDDVATPDTVKIVVAAPGEDLGSLVDAGSVHVFGLEAEPGQHDLTVKHGSGGLPGSAVEQELLGLSFAASSRGLTLANPYGGQAVYVIAWPDLAAGTATPRQVWRPGAGGVPAGGVAFGAAIG